MRLRNIPEAEDIIKQYPNLVRILEFKWEQQSTDFKVKELFNNDYPLHLEIGMGRGKFISTLVYDNPGINYVGIEKYTSVMYKALLRVKDNPPPNLKLLVMDANYLNRILDSGQVARIYLNFSDPWPKAGQAKNRLTHLRKLISYKQILQLGGEIHFKTDNAKLFEFSLNQFAEANFKLKNITFDLHGSDTIHNVMTEYEERFSKAGKNIYRLEAQYVG